MDNLVQLATRYAVPTVAATVGAMYLDAKHHIVKDINDWRSKRTFQKIVAEGKARLGDYHTLYHCLEGHDQKADAFWFEGRSWTFGDVRREADKLAQWFLDQGIRTKGIISLGKANSDFVAVYMTNSAEAYFTAMALSKLGVTNAMINSSLKGIPVRIQLI
jgi:hypothetical protein